MIVKVKVYQVGYVIMILKVFICIFHDVQQDPPNSIWGTLNPSYSTNPQPYMKPSSLQQPGKEPNPKPEKPSPHPLHSFLNVTYILFFLLHVWCERYTSCWFPTMRNLSLAVYCFLPSARFTSGKPTRRTEGVVVVTEHLAPMRVILTYLLTYSMEQSPSWEADQFSQLTKKFPTFYGTRGFFTVLTSARHLSLSWANSFQTHDPLPLPEHPS
jgi:hypothetical protein